MRSTLVVLATVLVIGGAMARAAHRFLPSINNARPALVETAPFAGPAPPRLARKVVLVIVDGLRLDATRGLPGLDALRGRGVDARARALFPTISKASYVTMLTGVPPRYSGARTNDGFHFVPLDSVFTRLAAAGRSAGYVADRTRGVPRLFDLTDSEVAGWDDGLAEVFVRSLVRNDLVVLLWMQVDEAGHRDGGASDGYREAVRSVDERLATMLATFDFARDAIVVTGDHGHTDRGGHGGLGPAVEDVPLVFAGAGIQPGATVERATLVDLAPTLAALLGVPAPGHGIGRTLVEVLAIDPAQRGGLVAADAQRTAYLEPILRDIAAADLERHRAARPWRVLVASIGLVCLTGLIILAARRRWLAIDGSALATASFTLVFHGLVFGLGRLRGTPSMPGGRAGMWHMHLLYGGVAVAVLLIACAIALRARPDRVARAHGAVLVGLLAIAAPAVAAWAMVGTTLATTLPSTELVMVSPTTYLGVVFYAAGATIVLAATSIAARRRAG